MPGIYREPANNIKNLQENGSIISRDMFETERKFVNWTLNQIRNFTLFEFRI